LHEKARHDTVDTYLRQREQNIMFNLQSAHFKTLVPNLMVDNINDTIDFYTHILGFHVMMTAPAAEPFSWVMLAHGPVTLMFQQRNSMIEEYPILAERQIASGSFTLFIEVEEVKELYHAIKDEVTIIKELEQTSYGTIEFALEDSNGFILTFAEKL